MPRLRKLRRKQKYQYHVSRRQLNKKEKKLPTIQCEAIRKAWNIKKGLNENLTSMGLVADTNDNKSFRIPSGRQQMRPLRSLEEKTQQVPAVPSSGGVVIALEKEAAEKFSAKKSVAHPLPSEVFKKLTRFLDKYGEDYEAMALDHSNYNQETAAQIRSQVNRLKKIPQQWTQYLKSRKLIPATEEEAKTRGDKPNVEILLTKSEEEIPESSLNAEVAFDFEAEYLDKKRKRIVEPELDQELLDTSDSDIDEIDLEPDVADMALD